MKTVHQHIRGNILKNLGMEERKKMPNLDSLQKTEWSPQFEKFMRNRLVMGSIRYGLLHAHGKQKYDRIQSCIDRLLLYKESHNMEHLVDVANLCLMEFEEGDHPDRHFEAQDDKNHTKEIKNV